MALKERIADDMKAALLGGNRFAGDVLRNLKAAILNEEVSQGKRDTGLDDADIEKVIAREIKKRREATKMYRDNARDDLADQEDKEADVLASYLPEQLDESAVRALVQAAITELGVSDKQAMGQVIGAVKKKAGNTADGAIVAKIVNDELNK